MAIKKFYNNFVSIRVVDETLMDVEIYRTRYENFTKLSKSALVVLKSFKASTEKRLRVAELEEATSIPRRTIQYTLKNWSKKGFCKGWEAVPAAASN